MMAGCARHGIPLTRLKAATGRTVLERCLAREDECPDHRHTAAIPVAREEGPLFAEHPAGTLREAAFRAAFHLEAG